MNIAHTTEWRFASVETKRRLLRDYRIDKIKNCGLPHEFDGNVFTFSGLPISYDPEKDICYYKKQSIGLGCIGTIQIVKSLSK